MGRDLNHSQPRNDSSGDTSSNQSSNYSASQASLNPSASNPSTNRNTTSRNTKGSPETVSEELERDEKELRERIEAARMCAGILEECGVQCPQSLKNAIILASSFAGYKKWDKVITYTKQSQKYCENLDRDLYRLCLEYQKIKKPSGFGPGY